MKLPPTDAKKGGKGHHLVISMKHAIAQIHHVTIQHMKENRVIQSFKKCSAKCRVKSRRGDNTSHVPLFCIFFIKYIYIYIYSLIFFYLCTTSGLLVVHATSMMGGFLFFQKKCLHALAHELCVLRGTMLSFLSIEIFNMDGIEFLWFFFSIHR